MNAVAAVIVHYDNWPDVLDTISDVLAQGIDEERVAFVDNGSDERVVSDLVRRHPRVRVLAGHGNVGYGAAVNLGAREFAGDPTVDRLLVLTHEVRLGDGALTALAHAMDRKVSAGAAAPVVHRKARPDEVWSAGGDISLHTLMPAARQTWEPSAPDWVDGCCFLVDKDLFLRLGGMYEPYFLYMEEVDFFLRMRRAGRHIVVVPEALALQDPGEMTLYHATRNQILLARRLGSPSTVLRIVTRHTLRLVIEAVLFPRSRRRKVAWRATGLYEGLTVRAARRQAVSAVESRGGEAA